MSSKPAKHTKQSFSDQQAINSVSAWLAETQRVMPDLKANDKYPNIDGYIELVDVEGYPKGILKAQVKKLSAAQIKRKEYFFKKKEDKFITYCKETLDWIPIVFIGVDLINNQAFWIHVSKEYVNKLNGGRLIKLIPEQIVKSGSSDFIKDWENIIKEYTAKAEEFDKYKKAYLILADVATPALGLVEERFINIHIFLDKLNVLLENEFQIVKNLYYPYSWKIGFAYYSYQANEVTYTLYPIPINKNDVQIKEINQNLHDRLQKEGLGFTGHSVINPIEKRPIEYAFEVIRPKVLRILQDKRLNHAESEFLAREYVFAFIDNFNEQMGLEKKNEYSYKEIEYGFNTYLLYWLDEVFKLMKAKNRNNFDERIKKGRIIYLDPEWISEISSEEREEIKEKVSKSIKDNTSTANRLIGNRKMPFGLFLEFLNFLNKKKEKIRRPYIPKNFSLIQNSWTWEVFSKSDTEHNFRVFVENLLQSYETLLNNNFPNIKDKLSFFGKADKIVLVTNIPDDLHKNTTWPRFQMFYLKLKNKEEHTKSIEIVSGNEAKLFESLGFLAKGVSFRAKEYDILRHSNSDLDFLYKDTPMLDFLYKLIEDNIKAYFKINES